MLKIIKTAVRGAVLVPVIVLMSACAPQSKTIPDQIVETTENAVKLPFQAARGVLEWNERHDKLATVSVSCREQIKDERGAVKAFALIIKNNGGESIANPLIRVRTCVNNQNLVHDGSYTTTITLEAGQEMEFTLPAQEGISFAAPFVNVWAEAGTAERK